MEGRAFMPTSVKELLASANAAVPKLSPEQAREKMQAGSLHGPR